MKPTAIEKEMKPKKDKRRSPRSVKASCDRLFSKLIRSRRFCERCGETKYEQLQCCHIYSRKFGSVRFSESNAVCLDAKCHRWAHDNPTEFTNWLYKIKGVEAIRALQVEKNTLTKRKLADWLTLEKELKEKLK